MIEVGQGPVLDRAVPLRRRQAHHLERREDAGRSSPEALPHAAVTWSAKRSRAHASLRSPPAPSDSSVALRALSDRQYRRRRAKRRRRSILALRPFQVNPPWQFLNTPGGVARDRQRSRCRARASASTATSSCRARSPRRAGFGAVTFDAGQHRGLAARRAASRRHLPSRDRVRPRVRRARVSARARRRARHRVDRHRGAAAPGGDRAASDAAAAAQAERLAPRDQLADAQSELAARSSSASTIAAAAVGVARRRARCGREPRLHPRSIATAGDPAGLASYERSWIRDGSLTSAALLRLGHAPEVQEFLEWYAGLPVRRTARCRAASTRAAPTRCRSTTATASSSTSSPSTTGTRRHGRAGEDLAARRCAPSAYIDSLRHAAHDARVPVGRQARLLRPPAAVDQPRGLLGEADALVLGRLLRAARLQGRRRASRTELGQAGSSARSPRCATSSGATCTRRSSSR